MEQNFVRCVFVVTCSCSKKSGQVGKNFFLKLFFLYKQHKEHRSKVQSNLNTLKSLTKKLNHLDHIKWHRRCKALTSQQTNTRSCCKKLLKQSSIIFCRILRKKVQVSYFLVGTVRSSRPELMFCKNDALKKFKGKHLCQSFFFNKVAGLSPATLLKKRLWHIFSRIVKFLKTLFLQNTSGGCFWTVGLLQTRKFFLV